MIKNTNSFSDIFVKNIVKKSKGIYHRDDILKIWIRSGGNEQRFQYALSILFAKKIAMRVAKDFLLLHSQSPDDFYWEIIAKITNEYTPNGVIIGGEKALECHMLNFSPTNTLILYTRDFSARIRLYEGREVHFRIMISGKKTNKKDFFTILKKYSQKMKNFGKILIPNMEISLLEALSVKEHDMGINDFLLQNFLQRNHKKLQKDIFEEIVKYKYIRPVNRLRIIARDNNYEELYQSMLFAIKTSGGGVFLNI